MQLPHLTPRSYLLAFAAAAVGVAGQWVPGVAPAAWLLPASALLLVIAWEGRECRRHPVGVSLSLPGTLRLGQLVEAELRVDNPGYWPRTVDLAVPLPDGLDGDASRRRVRIAAHGRAHVGWRIRGTRLGEVSFSEGYLRAGGPFGLSRWTARRPLGAGARVRPDLLRDRPGGRGLGRDGERPVPRVGSGGDLHGLREYWPGDPLRAIDWKATARRQRPMVKLLDDRQSLELMVLLDAGRGSAVEAGPLSRLHHFVNVAARLAQAGGEAGDRVGCICYASGVTAEVPLAAGLDGVARVRRVLQQVRSAPEESNPLIAALAARHLLRHRGLVVFLTDLTDAEAALQMLQAVRVLGRKHLPLVGALVDLEARALASDAAPGWLTPYRNLAGQELLQAQQLLGERLRRLGARVLIEPPDRLDGRMLAHFSALRRRRAV